MTNIRKKAKGKARKLELHKETVDDLSAGRAEEVKGGSAIAICVATAACNSAGCRPTQNNLTAQNCCVLRR